jgi:multidrug efflux pump subunit AcrA (membrane-fusion protein)
MKTKKLLFMLVIFSLLLTACGAEETPVPEMSTQALALDEVVAEGKLLPVSDVMLNFSAMGTVEEILVEEGDMVSKDDVIIRLADREQAEAALRAAELALTDAQQAYDDFVRTGGLATADAWQAYMDAQVVRAEAEREWEDVNVDTLEEDIDDAQAEVNDRQDDLDTALEDAEKYADLDADNTKRKDSEDDVETAQEDLNEALRKLEEVRQELDGPRAALDAALAAEAEAKRDYESRADDGLDPDQKALLEAQLANAKAQVDAAQSALDGYDLKAPFDGTITDINVEVGQLVGGELWAAQIADLSEFHVETSDLTELEVVKVYQGQHVEVVPDALPNLVLNGVVERVSESFRTQAGDVVYTVTIRLSDDDPALRWGMTVEVSFLTE